MNLHMGGDWAPMPFLAGVTGAVIMLGTLIGQSGNTNSSDDANPMAGMNMGPGSSMSSMPGMADSTSMPGMSPSGGAPAPGGATTMTMPDGSTMASAAMPMNMSDPGMAASMPGGLHTSCAGSTCTVIFAPGATGTAQVLGTTAKLGKASGKQALVTVGKKKLTLRQGKPVTAGGLKVELVSSGPKSWTVRFTKSH